MQDWDEPLVKYPLEDKGVGTPPKKHKKRFGLITHYFFSYTFRNDERWNYHVYHQWYTTDKSRQTAYNHALKNMNNRNLFYSPIHIELIER